MDLQDEVKAAVPTMDPVASVPQARRARALRRVGIAGMAVVILLACLDWLGPKASTSQTRGTSGELAVEYPQLTRRGLDSEVVVTHKPAKPVGGKVVLAVDRSMYVDLGLEQVIPEPLEQRLRGERIELTFPPPPPGTELVVTVTGRIPTQQVLGRYDYSITARTGEAEPLPLDLRTWVLP